MAAPSPGARPSAPQTEPQRPAEIVYAEEGDVILVLQNGKRLRVLAAVLSLVSPVFKTMLGPKFLEGQAPRTAKDPKEIQLPDDSVDGIVLLARFTHGLPSGAKPFKNSTLQFLSTRLLELGVAADKFDCIPAVTLAAEALMRRHAAYMDFEYTAAVSKPTVDGYAKFAAAAFLLQIDNLFTFFTRRLVLDAVDSFGEIFEMQVHGLLPPNVILGLEEQRSAVREYLLATVADSAHGQCKSKFCSFKAKGGTYPTELARLLSLPRWPPPWSAHRIRSVLQKLYKCESLALGNEYPCGHSDPSRLGSLELQQLCHKVSEQARGLCLTCARQDSLQSKCEHINELKAFSMNDPFMQA
ncbi:hypothetical protein LTR56_018908 [Elasticomyces elasticus]|nr:hypothetical protein LTR56_018908 [Elasticomyces elasticus]KAK3649847.1 hypothetical protein LTR22_012723 [Elasticomyces elasticus]KAK4918202.1 hypothetical protein LTR49_014058 [Elasticomyces elasticus]KAK5757748.1 hypothetical protein LTS12_012207 [Elasticomyces elasticus]